MSFNTWHRAFAIAASMLFWSVASAEFTVSVHVRSHAETSAGPGKGTLSDDDEHDSGVLSGISSVTQSAHTSVTGDLALLQRHQCYGDARSCDGHRNRLCCRRVHSMMHEIRTSVARPMPIRSMCLGRILTIGGTPGAPVDFMATLHLDSTVICQDHQSSADVAGRVTASTNLANFNLFVSDLLNGPDSLKPRIVYLHGGDTLSCGRGSFSELKLAPTPTRRVGQSRAEASNSVIFNFDPSRRGQLYQRKWSQLRGSPEPSSFVLLVTVIMVGADIYAPSRSKLCDDSLNLQSLVT